jgi:hypothetical protein
MLEARGESDLPNKAIHPNRSGEIRMQHLDRNQSLVAQVVSQPDRRHASMADLSLHRVSIAKDRVQVVAHA